ncbi:insulinase family protein [Euhalothece natronophila Z-M001]|uniref:Insulinase family protein n=1 Tax=Euhalothece natronophila Z-M001 TaxID=522448 RepID=A0A5B8NR56_9CHRO|nr:pitrilysin family protein [Euhalothece natronophila]QDZ40769.1 insulinase family protein [Euhalothece natronophila Z-M001]
MFINPFGGNKTIVKRIIATLLSILITWQGWGLNPAQAVGNPTDIQPYLERVKDRVTEYELDNGMTFVILPDSEAPVISFVTYVDVGSANEENTKTGVAHFLEHLAFKGTSKIGTTNYEEEQEVLQELDQVHQQLQTAQNEGDEEKIAELEASLEELKAEAEQYVKPNEFGQIVQREGGVGLNAATAADYTVYFSRFPANKLELWMSLESERFLDPVFRDFFSEQQVVLEERRVRTDNSPVGKMVENFLGTAFTTHPYQHPVIGYEEDIRSTTRQDIQDFFDLYYVPQKLTIAIVGDVDPEEVKELADVYFGRFPSRPSPPEVTTEEPPQTEVREVDVTLPSQPWYFEGYHRPAIDHEDHVVYEVIGRLLSAGRTSRLYQSLVEEKQVALSAQGLSSFPGNKFPNLVLFYALTAPNTSLEEVSEALTVEIEKLKTELVSEEELERVKTQLQANLLRDLDSNQGMARQLAEYEGKTGDWENLFAELEAIANVTVEDIQRVAEDTFTENNRTIGRILSENN